MGVGQSIVVIDSESRIMFGLCGQRSSLPKSRIKTHLRDRHNGLTTTYTSDTTRTDEHN